MTFFGRVDAGTDTPIFVLDDPHRLLFVDVVDVGILLIVDDHVIGFRVGIDDFVEAFFIHLVEGAGGAKVAGLIARDVVVEF